MTNEELVALLTGMDKKLDRLMAGLPKETAPARDLDSQYGDPTVRFRPTSWNGDDYKGYRFSDCPPDFLEALIDSLDYFADKEEKEQKMAKNGKPQWEYTRRDAARARGWLKRKREGWQSATPVDPPSSFTPPPSRHTQRPDERNPPSSIVDEESPF